MYKLNRNTVNAIMQFYGLDFEDEFIFREHHKNLGGRIILHRFSKDYKLQCLSRYSGLENKWSEGREDRLLYEEIIKVVRVPREE